MIRREMIPAWAPMGILVAAIALLFHRLLFGDVLFWGLPSLQFYPWRWLAFEQLRDGQLPFWNPYNGGGAPLLANYQSAILYPPNWLYFVLPGPRSMGLIALLHILWAGLGMWYLTGKLELSILGRGVSMISYAMGSYMLGRLGSFPTADAVSWIPWLFWGCLRVLEHRRILDVGLLGLITGLLLLVGHAQTSWYAFVGLGLFALWYVVWPLHAAGRRSQIEALVMSAVGLLLGAGIAAWQLLLTFEYLQESHRAGGVSYDELTNLSYAPYRILTMLAPKLFGTPADGSYLTPDRSVYYEDAAYIGLLPLISAVFAILGWVKWRKFLPHHVAFRSVPFWTALSITGFTLALGRFGPLYRLLYDYVPTFDNFREPVRWLIWPAFGLPILAGIGIHNWSHSHRTLFWTRLSLPGAIGIIGASIVSLLILTDVETDTLEVLARGLIAVGIWSVGCAVLTLRQPSSNKHGALLRWQTVVLVFIAVDLAWAVVGLNPTVTDDFYDRDLSISQPQGRLYWFQDYWDDVMFEYYFDTSDYRPATDRWPEIRTSLLPNLNILYRIELFNNYDYLQPAGHTQYVDLIEEKGEDATALLRAAGVGQVHGPTVPVGWDQAQGTNVAFAPEAPPLVWLVPNAVWAEDRQTAIDLLRTSDWNPEQTVILERGDPPDTDAEPFTESEIHTRSERATKRQYRITTDGAGFLVVANTWYPGWKVEVDGEDAQLYRANLSFQAVYIPPGGADVTFIYRPRMVGASLVTSVVSLFAVVSLIAIGLLSNDVAER